MTKNKNDILKPTYSHSEGINYFTADYCFATEQMVKTYKVTEEIPDFDDSIKGKDKYENFSDHCPLFIEVSKI